MSVITWDGHIIAADRQATRNGSRCTCHKLVKIDDYAIGWVGTQVHGLMMMDWFVDGADATKFPEIEEDENSCTRMIVATRKSITVYEREARGMTFMDKNQAWGSGMDVALGAMAMGADAIQAVKIACKLDINCGMGIDWFRVK
jgi:hypothetical protein